MTQDAGKPVFPTDAIDEVLHDEFSTKPKTTGSTIDEGPQVEEPLREKSSCGCICSTKSFWKIPLLIFAGITIFVGLLYVTRKRHK